MTVTRAPECVILVWGRCYDHQPITAEYCDQVTNRNTALLLTWSHIPLSVWDHNRLPSPLLQYDSWSSDQGRTSLVIKHQTSYPRVFVMKCFILLYGSNSVSVLGVYISSVRGNPIKVSPRLEIHEKMRNILTIPPHSRRLERGPMWSPSHGVQTLLTKNQVNNLYENRQSPDDQTENGTVSAIEGAVSVVKCAPS